MQIALFQGISPILPVIALFVLAIITTALSYFTYRNLKKAGPFKKWSLITLRSSTFLILILLLLNPFLSFESVTTESPEIAVYYDNSASTSIEKGDYAGLESYQQRIEQFEESRDQRFTYTEHLFDTEINSGKELTSDGTGTHIHDVMNHILENENQFKAALLFSDGISTQGRNPVFTAAQLSIPVFTFPLGDTTAVRDLAIPEVNFSDPVYTNTVNRITAEIQYQQVENEQTEVRLIENGTVVESAEIMFQSTSGSRLIEFERQYSEPGLFDLAIEIVPIESEFTTDNNSYSFTQDVLDDKTRIHSIAFEIHPDVAAIRHQIATDIQNELIQSTWLGGEQFYGTDPFSAEFIQEDIDLFIVHGESPAGSAIARRMVNLIDQKPVVMFSLPSSFNGTNSFNELKTIIQQTTGPAIEVRPVRTSSDLSHPLLELIIPPERSLPTLRSHQGEYSLSPAGQTLIRANFQGTETNIPILVSDEGANRRLATVNAYGWYQYRLSRQEEPAQFFSNMIDNLVSWSSTSPDRRTLTIEPLKSNYTENETIQLRGTLINERGEPELNGLVDVKILDIGSEAELSSFRMSHTGSGNYIADIGTLPSGTYRAEATAVSNNRDLGTDEARISVGQSNVEIINTQRDDATLRSIALNSGGLFLDELNFDRFNSFLEDQNLYESVEEITVTQSYLREYSTIWFALVILFLTAEWILRRSLSLP
jgi:hypothetical protein